MSPLNVRYSSYVRNILYVRALISLSNQKSLNYKKMQIMKKIILSSFVICTLLSACNKESLQEQQEIIPNEDLVQIVLSASYPESKADSKAFLNTDGRQGKMPECEYIYPDGDILHVLELFPVKNGDSRDV